MSTKQSALLALIALPVDKVVGKPDASQRWTILFACLEEMFHDEEELVLGFRHAKKCKRVLKKRACAVCWLEEHMQHDGGMLFSDSMNRTIWKKPIPGMGTSTNQPMLVMGHMKNTEFEGIETEGFHTAMYFHHFAYKSRNMFQGEFLVGDALAEKFFIRGRTS